jgi:ubiquinone/menaquinone biosynthesis C-methylase UbiE
MTIPAVIVRQSMTIEKRSSREKDHFDNLALTVGSVWWGSQTKAGKIRMNERAQLAIKHGKLRPGMRVLEPGAGNGEFTLRLAKSGATIRGIEISPRQVELGNDRLVNFANAKIVEGDIENLDFPDASFDAVVGNSVLHHFDLNHALPEITRVLKPRGNFFFCEPNMINPQIAIEKNIPFIGRMLQNSPDETAFIRWQIVKKLTLYGLERITATPFDFLHPGVPDQWIGGLMTFNRFLNRLPLVREIGGSLQIKANKPPHF